MPSPPGVSRATMTMLRTLRWNLVDLPPHHPYRLARLRRIADQLSYILENWGDQPWPGVTGQDHPLLTPAHHITQLRQLPLDVAAQQRYLLALVIALL